MNMCTKLVCASLLPLAGPAAAKARAPQEETGPLLGAFANVFVDAAAFDGYGARYEGGVADVRLAEVGVEVKNGAFNLRAAYDFAGDGEWRDAGVFWKNPSAFIGVGQFKEPASLEKFTFEEDAALAETPGFTHAFALSRRFGVVAGRFEPGWSLTAGAFAGSLDGRDAQGRGPGQTAFTARATINREIGSARVHAGGYGRALDYDGAGYVAAIYPGSKLAAKTHYADFTSVGADGLAERSVLFGLELAWSRPGFHLQAEAARQGLDFAVRPDAGLWGGAITASWIMTGEQRPYIKAKGVFGALTPDAPVTQGGAGALVASVRVDTADFSDAGLGRSTRWTAGLDWTLRDGVRLGGELTAERGARDSDTMLVRLRLGF